MTTAVPARPVGQLLRDWRERRRLSQLELSIQADISTRHLSFVETGRSRPTPEMILRLTEHLDVPLRERNQLLLAGGYAPAYPQHGSTRPSWPASATRCGWCCRATSPTRRWSSTAGGSWSTPTPRSACSPPAARPSCSAAGERAAAEPAPRRPGRPRSRNLAQVRAHLLEQLHRRARQTGDARLHELHAELPGYPGGTRRHRRRPTTSWCRCGCGTRPASCRSSRSPRPCRPRPTSRSPS